MADRRFEQLDWSHGVTLDECVGRTFRLTHEIHSSQMTLPAGTIVTLRQSRRWDDLRVKAPACEHCGVAPNMTGLQRRDLEPA